MSDWLNMVHPETGGEMRVPNSEGVQEAYEARGWKVVDPVDEDAAVFVPPKVVEANEEDGWVTLYHRETHAQHDFPSHPDAIKGAYDAGWQASPPKVSAPPEEPEVTAPAKKAPAKKPTPDTATPATDEGE